MKPFTCRRVASQKRWAVVTAIAMLASTLGGNLIVPVVHAQTAPVGQGFVLTAGDLRFIYAQILVAQEHAAGGTLLGPGPNQVADPQLPRGLPPSTDRSTTRARATVLRRGGSRVPASDDAVFKAAEPLTVDPDGPGGQAVGNSTSYTQKKDSSAIPSRA